VLHHKKNVWLFIAFSSLFSLSAPAATILNHFRTIHGFKGRNYGGKNSAIAVLVEGFSFVKMLFSLTAACFQRWEIYVPPV
jgi:hypothetical protein